MKITALRIGHFGKLHNVTIEPRDGLNLVMGDNESGKSTVFAFIGAMLFGIDRGRGRAGREDLYTKYLPWDTPGAYQGSMDFTHEGREYRITRVFYQREKSCTITDLTTGRRLETADESITSLIPELTRQAWNNTVSMGQKTLRYADDFGDEVRNHIANLAMTGSGQVDVASALDMLDSRRKSIQKASKDRVSSSQLRLRLQELAEAEREAAGLEKQIVELRDKVAAMDAKISELETEVPDVEKYTREWNFRMAKVDAALENLEKERETGNSPEPKATGSGAAVRNTGIIILAVGLLAAMLSSGKSMIGVGIGAVAMIVGLVCLLMAMIRNREGRMAAEKLQKTEEKTEIEGIKTGDTKTERTDSEHKNRENDYNTARRALEEAADRLREATEGRDRIFTEISSIERDRTAACGETDKLEWQLGEMGDIAAMIDECELELQKTEAEEQSDGIELEAVKLASDTIATLADQLHDSFASDFNGILSEEVSLATDGVYSSARINSDFEIEVMSGLDYVNAEQLSGGAVEQIYLAFRFAVARLMFDETEVPLLLDESFAYSDDSRLTAALSAIADRDGQVFVFTCSSREKNVLDALGAQYNAIMM